MNYPLCNCGKVAWHEVRGKLYCRTCVQDVKVKSLSEVRNLREPQPEVEKSGTAIQEFDPGLYYTFKAAAEVLGISEASISQYASIGKFTRYLFKDQYFLSVDEIHAYKEQRDRNLNAQ